MEDSFFIYLERLEAMAFFAGYPVFYLLIRFLSEVLQKKGLFKTDFVSLLPLAYVLVGLLYLGLQLKNLHPDYSVEHIKLMTQAPLLKIWGLLSVFFWLPALRKRPVLSLLHSLVFFFFFVKDLYLYFFDSLDKTVLKNDMNIYTNSLLINLAAFTFVTLLYFLLKYRNRLRTN